MLLLGWTNRKINVYTYVRTPAMFQMDCYSPLFPLKSEKLSSILDRIRIVLIFHIPKLFCKFYVIAKMQMHITYLLNSQCQSADAPT